MVGLAFADLFGVLYNVNYVENWGVFTFPIWEIEKERKKSFCLELALLPGLVFAQLGGLYNIENWDVFTFPI